MNFILKMAADIFLYLSFSSFVIAILNPPFAIWLLALLVVPVIYIIYSIVTIGEYTGQYEYAAIFKRFLKVYFFFSLFAVTVARNFFESASLPFAILFTITAVTLMRTTRNQEHIQKQLRFRLLNLIPIFFVLAAGFIVSSRQFLGLSAWLLSVTLVPLIQVIALAMALILHPIIYWFVTIAGWEVQIATEYYGTDGGAIMASDHIINTENFNNFSAFVTIALIAFAFYLIYLLFRKLAVRQAELTFTEGITQQYEAIMYDKPGKEQLQGNLLQFRKYYRRFLRLCWKNDIPHDVHMTSADYEYHSAEKFDIASEAKDLRNFYIPVRYGEKEVTKADINHIKSLYRRIKKQGGKQI